MADRKSLALYGGEPVRDKPLPMMHPGASFIDDKEIKAVTEVLKKQSPYRFYGPHFLNVTGRFEDQLRGYVGSRHALAVTSGTAALHTALVAAGAGPGTEVILPTYAWVSCPDAIVASGATPVLADVDDSLTLDPKDVEKKITNRTKVIMAVHIRGAPANLDTISKLANEYGVTLLEDVAQAGGGSYKGKKLGSIGKIASFSFQLNKIISAGEGGAVLTNDRELFERALMFHDTGTPFRSVKYTIKPFPGVNYRMTELMAAVLREQLRKIDGIVARIRANKRRIKKGISDVSGIRFRRMNDAEGETGVCLVFFVDSPAKAIRFRDALVAENIRTPSGGYPGVVYDPKLNDGHVFMQWGHILPGIEKVRSRYSKSLNLMSRAVHLDISPLLTDQDAADVVRAVQKVAAVIL